MFKHLHNILKETETRMSHNIKIPYEFEFEIQLKSLDEYDKLLLRKKFLDIKWNIGSARMFVILNDFISIVPYLLLKDEDTSLNIFNDLLETEYTLLEEVIIFAYSDCLNSHQILDLLNKSFNFLIQDLFQTSNLLLNNYLSGLKQQKLDSDLLQKIKDTHMNLFLDLDSCSIIEAIGLQHLWNIDVLNPVLIDLMTETMSSEVTSLSNLLEVIGEDFIGWKYYTKLLGIIFSKFNTNKFCSIIKKFLKETFKQFLINKRESSLFIMFLTARSICLVNSAIIGTYSQWYKETIGEMTYLITTEEFKYTMQILKKMIAFEKDCEIIKIHKNLGISAPSLCNELVIMYKQLLKIRLQDLEGMFFETENFVILDGDGE